MSGAVPGTGVFGRVSGFPQRRIRIGHAVGHGLFHHGFGHTLLHGALWATIIVIVLVVVAVVLIARRFLLRRSRRPF